jgi:hemolysin III
MSQSEGLTKPFLRGHFHQAAFFTALGACSMLLARCSDSKTFIAILVYSLSLTGLLGISALYHRIQWPPTKRMWMRRLDHAAIFVLIAGTGTPIFLLSFAAEMGLRMVLLVWLAATCGVLQSLFWVNAPKWVGATLAVAAGWIIIPYFSELSQSLSVSSRWFLVTGGVLYTLGAVIYAMKWPNPSPRFFGYHEIFHILVVIAAAFHFLLIYNLL